MVAVSDNNNINGTGMNMLTDFLTKIVKCRISIFIPTSQLCRLFNGIMILKLS